MYCHPVKKIILVLHLGAVFKAKEAFFKDLPGIMLGAFQRNRQGSCRQELIVLKRVGTEIGQLLKKVSMCFNLL